MKKYNSLLPCIKFIFTYIIKNINCKICEDNRFLIDFICMI